ncbi:response regulator transcription factor [Heliorestis acidaminivorans]|uniref:Stage 0 sporulation protein A homolog n=1 Tax=Heliorestis acidaminivorans TaxID=553427 RepID=A0A6I0EXZ8_9FIRM|nr:response regulator transcription factor [Heliorestis acidaminivorans]KAB2953281.1 response regulator transcription factor [Heliorestis acidaminivorans]
MEEKKTILLVEDDIKIRRMLRMFIEQENMQVLEAEEGFAALEILAKEAVDVIVLDLMMPGLDGWTTCRKIREQGDMPILILTARGDEANRLLGFELGADDYVVKPFSPREIVMRIKALLRRNGQAKQKVDQGEEALHFPGLDIFPDEHKVLVEGQSALLSPLEYNLLLFMARNSQRVLTRDMLLDRVWGYDFAGDSRTVDTHVRRLREKISRNSEKVASYIVTVRGAGYKFEVLR